MSVRVKRILSFAVLAVATVGLFFIFLQSG